MNLGNINIYDGVPSKYLRIKEQTCSNTGKKVLVAKYSKKAFFEQAWNEYPALLNARGHIYDMEGKLLSLPFEKVFNYSENGAGLDVRPETFVNVVRKVNGFFAATTMTDMGLMIQTSGSVQGTNADGTSNMFWRMARQMISELPDRAKEYIYQYSPKQSNTFMFEVVHPDDPHIVVEEPGLYLIGCSYFSQDTIEKQTKFYIGEPVLNKIAQKYQFKRYNSCVTTFDVALEEAMNPSVEHEGFMIRHVDGKYICKVKSKRYLSQKLLARATTVSKLQSVQNPNHPQYDEEVVAMIRYLNDRNVSLEAFIEMEEQDRLKIIRTKF